MRMAGAVVDGVGEASEGDGQVVTAIYRPESNEDWMEKLRNAGRRAYPTSIGTNGSNGGDKELEGLEWDLGNGTEERESASGEGSNGATDRVWKCARTLRNHLEAVRAVEVFEGENGPEVVSAGDDFVVKLWRGVLTTSPYVSSLLCPSYARDGY